MKTTLILLFSIMLFGACEQNSQERYTQEAPEIDIYKSAVADYESQNWEGIRSHYADTAKIYFNTLEGNHKTIDQTIAEDREMVKMFSEYGLIKDSGDIERVITDDGETWVNYWGTWYGVLAESGKRVETPVHFTVRFIDNKIVQEHAYFDNLPVYLAIQEAEAAMAEEVMEGEEEAGGDGE